MRPVNKKSNSNWIYGHHAVTAALQNPNRKNILIKMTKDCQFDKALAQKTPIQIVSRQEIDSLFNAGVVHQGIALQTSPLPPVSIEDIIEKTEAEEKTVILMLDQVTDPHNIGALLRSSAAFGAAAVILSDAGAPEENNSTMAKSACGGLEIVPLVRVSNLARTIERLQKAGFWVLGLDGYAKKLINEDTLPAKTVFVLGSEGDGMRRLTAEKCDYLIKLPISENMESLNVSNAGAIALYEFYRQK